MSGPGPARPRRPPAITRRPARVPSLSRCAFCTREVHFASENDGWNCTFECEVHVSASGGARGGLRRGPRAPFARRSARRGRRPGRDAPWRTFPRALGGAVCPNLLQRPPSGRDAREESLIFRGSAPGRSGRRAPLQQIWTTARPGSSQEPHPHHRDRTSPARRARDPSVRNSAAPPRHAPGDSPGGPASATPFVLCCAPSPSDVREEGAQRRVKGRSRRRGAAPARPREPRPS